ncbi:MAG UNVERIFIED_CONTAM: hypothetical protein LVR18_38260 [Planctomycetaceae bacterium]|jgi:hypothetical protein
MQTDQFNSSVLVDGSMIYAVEGRGGGSIAIRGGGKGDVTADHIAWSGNDSNRFSTPLLYDGRLYLISGSTVKCIKAADGSEVFQDGFSHRGLVVVKLMHRVSRGLLVAQVRPVLPAAPADRRLPGSLPAAVAVVLADLVVLAAVAEAVAAWAARIIHLPSWATERSSTSAAAANCTC